MGFFKRFRKPKATVLLTLPKTTLELGEALDATISVSSREEFDATQIRVELKCIEKKRRERWVYDRGLRHERREVYWDTAILHSAAPKATGKLHLVPGFRKTFHMKFGVPAGGRESFDGLDGNVTWNVKGVIAVDGRPDVTGQTIELQVIGLSQSKPKEQKVTMKPCEYCGTVMLKTASYCPNCGAPQKK